MTQHPDAPSGQPYSGPPEGHLPPPSYEHITVDHGPIRMYDEYGHPISRPGGGDGGGGKKHRKWPWIIGGVFLLIVIAGVAAGNSADPAPKVALPSASQAPYPSLPPEQKAANPSASHAPKAPLAPTATVAPKPKPAPQLTAGQEQAIGAAKDYLTLSGFSRIGLIKQLSSAYGDGFSKADATFAVDYLHVNWKEQAVRSAKDYLATTHFSRAGLIDQLSSQYGDGYTRAEAVYAANKVGL